MSGLLLLPLPLLFLLSSCKGEREEEVQGGREGGERPLSSLARGCWWRWAHPTHRPTDPPTFNQTEPERIEEEEEEAATPVCGGEKGRVEETFFPLLLLPVSSSNIAFVGGGGTIITVGRERERSCRAGRGGGGGGG